MVQQQIAEREQQRLLDEERRDQEQQQMLHYLERLQKEDMDAMEQKRKDQQQLMTEVGKANAVSYRALSLSVKLTRTITEITTQKVNMSMFQHSTFGEMEHDVPHTFVLFSSFGKVTVVHVI